MKCFNLSTRNSHLLLCLLVAVVVPKAYAEDAGPTAHATSYLRPRRHLAGDGVACFTDDGCNNKACGYEFGTTGGQICCPSGATVDFDAKGYCTGMENGHTCASDDMCQSKNCDDSEGVCLPPQARQGCADDSSCPEGACGYKFGTGGGKMCCPSGVTIEYTYKATNTTRTYCTNTPDGRNCAVNAMCQSNNCKGGVCQPQKKPFASFCFSDKMCPGDVKCGSRWSSGAGKICCPSGTTTSFNRKSYCTGASNGSNCASGAMCESGKCEDGTCVPEE